MRTSTVLTCSFVELQVLKRKDWRNVINTNPGELHVSHTSPRIFPNLNPPPGGPLKASSRSWKTWRKRD